MPQNPGICPYLGLSSDPSVRLSYVDKGHRCYALSSGEVIQPDADHQLRHCLSSAHPACPRYVAADARTPAEVGRRPQPPRSRSKPPWRVALWVVIGLAALAVVWQLARLLAAPQPPAAPLAQAATATPTASAPPVMPTPDPLFAAASPTAAAVATPTSPGRIAAVSTPTVAAGQLFYNLAPEATGVGWVSSGEARGNHLGDSFLHAGTVGGNIFHGVLQFDLSRVPRGAPILYAVLTLTGLDDARLDRASGDSWQARWLAPEINQEPEWSRQDFQSIHNAPVQQTILPALRPDALAPFAVNQFVFDQAQRALLQQALVDGQSLAAFRLDGPEGGPDNLFTWDSGYGPATRQNMPGLWIVTGPAPATPPPLPTEDYVVVTSTPTPANVLTAAAQKQTAVAVEQRIGTATPTPRRFVTATPTPLNEATAQAERLALGLPFVVTPTLPPLNPATATADALYATAVAITTGTWTPLPQGYVTATPTATFVVVTNTPTAGSIFELLDRVIAEATRTATAGPPTPFPPGVVTATPTWTATPEPQNAETAQALVILATIQAITTGNWTPTPTATPGAAVPTETAVALPAVLPTVTLQEGAPLGVVISEIANVRQGPDITFPVLTQVISNTQLSLVGRAQDSVWLAVCCVDGQQGWIAAFLIATDADVDGLPVLPEPSVFDQVAARLARALGRLAGRSG